MLHELALGSASRQEKKPLTNSDFIQRARKRHSDLVVRTSPPNPDDWALRLLYTTHTIEHEDLEPQVKAKLKERTKDKPLIDLGAGDGLKFDTIAYFEISPYIGVDLRIGRALPNSRNMDALEYLLKTNNGYGNIMATGFLCRDWFPEGGEGYVEHILREIRKVLHKDGVFIASHFDFQDEALAAGLKINEELSKVRGNITVFERGLLPPRK